MHGVEVEVSDGEKYHAQKSIRRSVVSKDKLSWSQQFASGSLSSHGDTKLESVHKLFIDSRGARAAINSIKAELIELIMPNKDLTIVPSLSKNLKTLDLQANKLEYLPDSICDLRHLQKLAVDSN